MEHNIYFFVAAENNQNEESLSCQNNQEAAMTNSRRLHITKLLWGEIVKMRTRRAVRMPEKPQLYIAEEDYTLQTSV